MVIPPAPLPFGLLTGPAALTAPPSSGGNFKRSFYWATKRGTPISSSSTREPRPRSIPPSPLFCQMEREGDRTLNLFFLAAPPLAALQQQQHGSKVNENLIADCPQRLWRQRRETLRRRGRSQDPGVGQETGQSRGREGAWKWNGLLPPPPVGKDSPTDRGSLAGRTAGGGGNQQLPSQPPSPLSFHHKDDSLIGQNCLLAGGSELCGCSLLSAPLPSASPTGWHLRG